LSEKPRVAIWTDGACSGNPGPGGWGAILVYKGHEKELTGGEAFTTNNRSRMPTFGSGSTRRPSATRLPGIGSAATPGRWATNGPTSSPGKA
jgi:ribonuclease HI